MRRLKSIASGRTSISSDPVSYFFRSLLSFISLVFFFPVNVVLRCSPFCCMESWFLAIICHFCFLFVISFISDSFLTDVWILRSLFPGDGNCCSYVLDNIGSDSRLWSICVDYFVRMLKFVISLGFLSEVCWNVYDSMYISEFHSYLNVDFVAVLFDIIWCIIFMYHLNYISLTYGCSWL